MQTETKTVPVTCDTCSSDLTYTRTISDDGEHRTTTLQCHACPREAGAEALVLFEKKQVIRAFLCPGGLTEVGTIWVPDERRGLHSV